MFSSDDVYDAIIIGSGPAGLTAGIYTSRAKLRTAIFERMTMGGELMNRQMIENYPGYADGVMGPDLGSNMMTQVMNLGAEFKLEEVERVELAGKIKTVHTAAGTHQARAVIIASGSNPRKLGVPGEDEFADKGVFYCATCDGPRFSGKAVAVAGGGDSGVTEALFMCGMASKVTVIEAMSCLNATPLLQDKCREPSNLDVKCGVKIEAIRGDSEVRQIDLVDIQSGQKSVLAVDGVLVRIGLVPNTGYLKGSLTLADNGQVKVDEDLKTEIPGVFAAGDLRTHSPMQVSTAVGDGATAALSLIRYLKTA